MMIIGDQEGQIFHSILTTIMDSISSSPLNASFYIGKTRKRLPENPEYAERQQICDMVTSFLH